MSGVRPCTTGRAGHVRPESGRIPAGTTAGNYFL